MKFSAVTDVADTFYEIQPRQLSVFEKLSHKILQCPKLKNNFKVVEEALPFLPIRH